MTAIATAARGIAGQRLRWSKRDSIGQLPNIGKVKPILTRRLVVRVAVMRGGDVMPSDANAGKPYCRPEDISGIDYVTDLNDPGAYPYTRGRRTQPRSEEHTSELQSP